MCRQTAEVDTPQTLTRVKFAALTLSAIGFAAFWLFMQLGALSARLRG